MNSVQVCPGVTIAYNFANTVLGIDPAATLTQLQAN